MEQEQAARILGVKSTNPKDFQGFKKVPYHLFPMTALAVGAIQFLDGGGKYGRENYREEDVRASIYHDAAIRHILDWFHGEDRTPDTLLRHLGGALASIAILIDAEVNGNLIDDRAHISNRFSLLMEELNRETLRLADKHKDKSPQHFSRLTGYKGTLKAKKEFEEKMKKAVTEAADLEFGGCPTWGKEDAPLSSMPRENKSKRHSKLSSRNSDRKQARISKKSKR